MPDLTTLSPPDPRLEADPLTDAPLFDAGAPDEVDRLAAAVLRAERRLRMIEELSELSMDLTRRVHRRAVAEADAADPWARQPAAALDQDEPQPIPTRSGPDAAAGFAKLSRTVRLCLDMEARADEALRALHAGEPAVLAVRETRRAKQVVDHREQAELDIFRMMHPVIREAAESEAQESELFAAMVERVKHDDVYADLQTAGDAVTIARLCEDLGLKPDWNTWSPDGPRRPAEAMMFIDRPAWSPFNRVSGKPILKRSQFYPRAALGEADEAFEAEARAIVQDREMDIGSYTNLE